jgi:hypothetical protein
MQQSATLMTVQLGSKCTKKNTTISHTNDEKMPATHSGPSYSGHHWTIYQSTGSQKIKE